MTHIARIGFGIAVTGYLIAKSINKDYDILDLLLDGAIGYIGGTAVLGSIADQFIGEHD